MGDCRKVVETVREVAKRFRLPPGGYLVVFRSVAEERCTALSDVDVLVKGLDPEEAGRSDR